MGMVSKKYHTIITMTVIIYWTVNTTHGIIIYLNSFFWTLTDEYQIINHTYLKKEDGWIYKQQWTCLEVLSNEIIK